MESWLVTAIIFGITQVGSLVWVLATLRGDARVVNVQLAGMQEQIAQQAKILERQSSVIEALVSQRQEIALVQERMLLQGRRFDELAARVNTFLDKSHV